MRYLALLCCFVVMVAVASAAEFNKTDYCGVYPYPQEIPALQALNPALAQYKPQLIDFYTFTRHGDRSTLVSNCFANTPQANRNWTQCPNETIQWHTGLEERNPYLPSYPIPLHPLQDKQILLGNCHLGQLTQKGAMMSYNNGNRVGKYLNQSFAKTPHILSEQNLELRTTDVHRTKETAISWITGVLDNMWNVNISNIPTMTFVDDKVDAFKLNTNMCQTAPYLAEAYGTEEYKKYTKDIVAPLTAELKKVLNQDTNINDVYDCIKPTVCHGLSLPDGLAPLQEAVENAATHYWQVGFNYDRKRSSQLFSGTTLIELSQHFSRSAIKTPQQKPSVKLFSGHDFGPMMNLVSALIGGDSVFWPPYSAMMNVEFYRTQLPIDSETSFVRFMYLGEVVKPLFCAENIISGEFCPTSILLNYIKDTLPTREQCPGYVRYNWPTIGEWEHSDLQALSDASHKTASAIIGLNKAVTALRDSYIPMLEQEQPKELSHVERWSQFS